MSRKSGGDVGLTSFVGRREDLAEGRRLLGHARLITLVGPGGVGKTRLARRLTDEVARAFPDGTFLVELAQLHDPDALPTALATALEIEDVGRSSQDALIAFVRERRLLVVLDNCEHLVDACARLVHTLLHASPGLRVVATSRQPLGVSGEQLLTVEPLSLPSPDDVRRHDLGSSEAAELFAERARLVLPAFELGAGNADHVARLCTILDGMPLAIELAAARLRVLSLPQLAERLQDRFGVLTVAAATAIPQHQTLRASVDWSFDLCSPHEQSLWAWLSVFEGGCDLDAVETVCAGSGLNVFDAVAGLVDKSVLTPHEAGGRVRYRMLETLRAYGTERLVERGEADELRRRHRAFFVGFARSVGQAWFGPDQPDLFARTDAEMANLRAAFDASLESPESHQDALELVTSLWWYWTGKGALHDGMRWFERALSMPLEPTQITLHALSRAAWVAVLRGDHELFESLAQQALALPVSVNSDSARSDISRVRSLLSSANGDPPEAVAENLRALSEEAQVERLGPAEAVDARIWLSLRLAWSGRPDEALEHIDDALEICLEHHDDWYRNYLLSLKGARLADLHRYDEALDVERDALRLAGNGFSAYSRVTAIDATAQIFSGLDHAYDAAVLFGALSGIWPDMGAEPMPGDESRHAAREQRARELLGEDDYAAAFERGRMLTPDGVVSFVVGDDVAPARPAPRAPDVAVTLTKRELEVAELVARGLSNKEIAQSLVVSPRTAEGHVTRLLDKLGFDSRARVAAWVAERRADGQ